LSQAEAILEARQVSRRFPGTLALDRVDFEVRRGQVHALIGENGAGKSTLVKILAGADQPTHGTLRLDGAEVRFRDVRDADRRGIGIIYQELNLCPNLSVAENIFLGRELRKAPGVVDHQRQNQRASKLLARLEHPIDPRRLVGELPLGQQQIVEIAKALARDVRVLIMDEPTSALSAGEVAVLFRIIAELKAHGVAVVYISHRLEELVAVADRVTVLRDGRKVASAPIAEASVPWIVERMTGRAGGAIESRAPAARGEALLRVEGLTLTPRLDAVTFTLAAGEVLGIYGLMGAGRSELMEALMGLAPRAAGSVTLAGRRLDRMSVPGRIAAGLAMVPESRQEAGLVQGLSLRDNITLASLDRLSRGGYLSTAAESRAAAALVEELRIKTATLTQPIDSLSGGNQQKAIIARCLLTAPKVLLLDDPARGVDVVAKAEIYAMMRRLAARGIGILFASSELAEVKGVADRILVLSRGRLTGEFDAAGVRDDELVSAACAGVEV
jgi:erythritol transport system ATP-binding protein